MYICQQWDLCRTRVVHICDEVFRVKSGRADDPDAQRTRFLGHFCARETFRGSLLLIFRVCDRI